MTSYLLLKQGTVLLYFVIKFEWRGNCTLWMLWTIFYISIINKSFFYIKKYIFSASSINYFIRGYSNEKVTQNNFNEIRDNAIFHQQKSSVQMSWNFPRLTEISPVADGYMGQAGKYFLIWIHFPGWVRYFFAMKQAQKKCSLIILYTVIIIL